MEIFTLRRNLHNQIMHMPVLYKLRQMFYMLLVYFLCIPIDTVYSQTSNFSIDLLGSFQWQVHRATNGDFICVSSMFENSAFGTTNIPLNTSLANELLVIRYDTLGNLIWFHNLFSHPNSNATMSNIPFSGYNPITDELWVGARFRNTLVLGSQVYQSPGFPADDYFFAKVSGANGNVISSFQTSNSMGSGWLTGIDVSTSGDWYISGEFSNTMTFRGVSITGQSSNLFIFKVDSSGNAIWGKNIGSTRLEREIKLKVIDNQNLVITFSSDTNVVNWGSGQIQGMTNPFMQTGYICRVDSSGNVIWSNGLELDGLVLVSYLTPANKLLIAGRFTQSMDWGSTTLTNSPLDTSSFIGQLDMNGNYEWIRQYKASGATYITALAVNLQKDIFVAGHLDFTFSPVQGQTLFSGGQRKSFVFKADSIGNPIWAQQVFCPDISQAIALYLNPLNNQLWLANNVVNSVPNSYYTLDTMYVDCKQAGYISSVIKIHDAHNKLSGYLFLDANSNGIKEPGESGIPGRPIQLNTGVPVTLTDSFGRYAFFISGGTYGVQYNLIGPYYNYTMNPLPQVTFSGTGQIDSTAHIGIYAPPGIHDKNIYAANLTLARAGRDMAYHIVCKNWGSTTQSDTITIVLDSVVTYTMAIPAPSLISGQTLYWYTGLFPPFLDQEIHLQTFVPTHVPLGTQLHTFGSISNISIDMTPFDNVFHDYTTVIGPYDPNYKTVSMETLSPVELLKSPWLEYTIHFQNLGTDTAFQVLILDTLSTYLQFDSIEVMGSSFPVRFTLNAKGVASFFFDDIRLPHEQVNPIGSCGYVKYRIKPKKNIALGEKIKNYADIYFDHAAPVRTDTATTTIAWPVSAHSSIITPALHTYPNPIRNGSLYLEWDKKSNQSHLEIYSTSGQFIQSHVLQQNPGFQQICIQDMGLSSGVYFCTLRDHHAVHHFRIMVSAEE
jgi:hypothetical protein